ncbi:beta-ketoacyl synthase domain-containing protein [Colletotrichum abscissum]|uniref:Beta-ketoacyl synthase domain-containing protein n=1 Tax=Colletotrichum abscissum TaxID=1671311 RepID=A0A9P9XJT0_9PEZI|nr:beta-ketoacyl synthase domain-containing protein [Colletotrichum abscissum]
MTINDGRNGAYTIPNNNYPSNGTNGATYTDGPNGINDINGYNGSSVNGPTNGPPQAHEPIAVIGMGCRLPGEVDNPHALTQLLKRGGVARNEPPESRFSLDGHHDGSKKPKTMRSPGGMFLENIDPREFDAGFFQVPRLDAIAMDPQQRQLLEVVYECLENSGVTLQELQGAQVECFVGSYAVDYADMQARDPEDRAPSVTIGVGRAILSNRISHFLNIKGPSMTIDTACSGSLVALDVACRYLRTREMDGAIVAGCNLYLSPEHNMDVGPMKGASSLSGKCHTFDVKADGYIKGEAVNAVMVKRLSDALRDGDPIRAVILGTATNSDGNTPGIASPSSEAQAAAIRSAYANAGITNFNETTYLECHGTGTQAGDPTEVSGIASVFAPSRSPDQPLIIGSIKSNIGHSEPAAGISGLIKTILSLETGTIFGNPTFVTPNPKIDFKGQKVFATRTSIPWPTGARKRASVNSFGYGGSNAHVVLESADQYLQNNQTCSHVSSHLAEEADLFGDDNDASSTASVAKKPQLLVFSANNEFSLRGYVKLLRKHLLNPSVKADLRDLSFTLSSKRSAHFNRGFLLADKAVIAEDSLVLGKKSPEAPKIGFVFTGQGAQWSQMGKALVDAFPTARDLLKHLDTVLKTALVPPTWSLLDELVEPRSPGLLRQPEFSQPLCTALQLAILSVLEVWGIAPHSVVGHSSGEIAAAYAAGYLSKEDAIKVAYYRGLAAKQLANVVDGTKNVGMLAVGLGAEAVMPFLEPYAGLVHIACFNSPSSVTLSGKVDKLEEVMASLVAESHFARLLQVNLAYHSPFMLEVSSLYEALLRQDFGACKKDRKHDNVRMFSSVSGKEMRHAADAAYWKSNMSSAVRFEQATKTMLADDNRPDFLIEIGPSGALSGPVAQVKKAVLGDGAEVQYIAAWSRGPAALKSLYEVAGKLFISGGEVNLANVNKTETWKPRTIIDLPNYSWDHSTQYWYESDASKDWRYRLFPHHDLLGSKILGTSWQAPSFKKSLKLADLPWLRDHKMGPEIVFPAAGFIAMAMEAIRQNTEALRTLEAKVLPTAYHYKLRDINFIRALVLDDSDEATKVMLALHPRTGAKDSWYEFKISSQVGDAWLENCRGLVRIQESTPENLTAAEGTVKPLVDPVPGALWYKAMHDTGYNFGPVFQKHLEIESIAGSRESRSLVDLSPPASEHPQSWYPMHPAAIDGSFQSCAPSLWAGDRPGISAVLVPAIIDELTIFPVESVSGKGISTTSSEYVGLGLPESTKSYKSNAVVLDSETGDLRFKLTGLRYHQLDTQEDPYSSHTYSRISWKPDVTFLTGDTVAAIAAAEDPLNEFIDLTAHKFPSLSVLESSMIPSEAGSVWLEGSKADPVVRSACRSFQFSSHDASAVVNAEETYGSKSGVAYAVLDVAADPEKLQTPDKTFDLVIIRAADGSSESQENVVRNARTLVSDGGHVVIQSIGADVPEISSSSGFCSSFSIPSGDGNTVHILVAASEAVSKKQGIELIHFSDPTDVTAQVVSDLSKFGWQITDTEHTQDDHRTILVLSDLSAPVLPTITEAQWQLLKNTLVSGNQVLWVTSGSQLNVTSPDRAMIHGLGRTVRNEDPSISITTLDVESATGPKTVSAINDILEHLGRAVHRRQTTGIENEFVERQGVIHISRVQPNEAVNVVEKALAHGAELVEGELHEFNTTVRLQCERVGTIDSLQYTEVAATELPVPDGSVEVELFAAGLNFKDVAVTMGIVPENQHLLGLEGAGEIRRAGKNAANIYKPGDRVLVFKKGAFGNRVIASVERTHHIPNWMSFEEASTLASVYLTALYSIFDLANTQAGHKVLIHSASGGLGIASIQICKFIGAEIYATVGTDEKVDFLVDSFGIPRENIFNSRTTAFAAQLKAATKGHGVDVILNSLTGDILDESWRCIADGGTMVELGKRDMLDRNYLSMEPFGRNASYRCFDMSHEHVSDIVIARLMRQMMSLISQRAIKPIAPMTTFPFEDVAGAFRYMRAAKHVGKIVLSAKDKADKPTVMVRPAIRRFDLPQTTSILIVGGLKGLCGSLAVYLAQKGAKHLVILARGGYDDERSQAVLKNIHAQGAKVDLVRGDVSVLEDVRRAFKSSSVPVSGVIQGAMVLRDKIFTSMTTQEYHGAVACKVPGTWNLHNVAQEEGLDLSFFTMLSSVSGVVGQKGQANYAAANAFLDAFAVYRQGLGLSAVSVDLGAIDDVGYMHEHNDLRVALDRDAWTPINENLFRQIVRVSIQQQQRTSSTGNSTQLITSIAVPQPDSSNLLVDARFISLAFGTGEATSGGDGKDDKSRAVQALMLLLQSSADSSVVLKAAVDVVNTQFQATLRLSEPMEPAKPLSSYGLDSLSAVELRNWVRLDLGVELTTLEITSATSLTALCEKIVSKMKKKE